ncbi:MAG TPA: hypothetical protein EYP78_00695 [Candidatus Omnitrophica bacterium]|nr:hypothetical protein [Candidatus Omnitrophota bacterium]
MTKPTKSDFTRSGRWFNRVYFWYIFLAISLGPKIVKVPVTPALEWSVVAIVTAVSFSVISSYFPAKRAADLDPAEILQEE